MVLKATKKIRFEATDEQSVIFEFVKKERQNGIVEALAGTGKTTTQVRSLRHVNGKSGSVGALAFNRSIANELKSQMPQFVWSGTMHGRGYGLLSRFLGRKLDMKGQKHYWLVKELAASEGLRLGRGEIANVVKAFDFVRILCWDYRSLEEERVRDDLVRLLEQIEVRFGVAMRWYTAGLVSKLMRLGVERFEETGMIDYGDMISLPLYYGLTGKNRFGLLMVDECQDLNAAQQMFAVQSGERLVCVGDRHQSIYGFRGADPNAFSNLPSMLDPTVLPLTMSQRCPQSVVGLAKQLVPSFRARPDATDGEIREGVASSELVNLVQPGDLVLCRINYPLAGLLFGMWKVGIRAKIIGRDLEKIVLEVIENVERIREGSSFLEKLWKYETREVKRMEDQGTLATVIDDFRDRCKTVEQIVTGCGGESGIVEKLKLMFSETDNDRLVRLSTIHRAKGLEADRVFIVMPELIPLSLAKEDWERQQELNLAYVAVTRAKRKLVFCGSTPRCFALGSGDMTDIG